jgi:hypothetical protein
VNDNKIVAMYTHWSEDRYSAGFILPETGVVTEFRQWLKESDGVSLDDDAKFRLQQLDQGEKQFSYEIAMLAEYHRQVAP